MLFILTSVTLKLCPLQNFAMIDMVITTIATNRWKTLAVFVVTGFPPSKQCIFSWKRQPAVLMCLRRPCGLASVFMVALISKVFCVLHLWLLYFLIYSVYFQARVSVLSSPCMSFLIVGFHIRVRCLLLYYFVFKIRYRFNYSFHHNLTHLLRT